MGQILFFSTTLLLAFSLLNLDDFLKELELKVELRKATHLWLTDEPLSEQRVDGVLVCESGRLKYCFDKRQCHKVLRGRFYCHLIKDNGLLLLRITYGNQHRDFNYIFNPHNSYYVPNNRPVNLDG